MPSSELQSRMTSLPISWDPWIWQCGAEGGTIIGRVRNKDAFTVSQLMTERTSTFRALEPQRTMFVGHIPEDYLMREARGLSGTIHGAWAQVQDPQLRLTGGKHVKGARPFHSIFKESYGLGFTLLPLKKNV